MKKWILDLTGRDGAQTTQKVYMCTDWIRTKYEYLSSAHNSKSSAISPYTSLGPMIFIIYFKIKLFI